MTRSRRSFFKTVGAAGVGLAAAAGAAESAAGEASGTEELGMLYDATRCVGCKACMAACKRVNAGPGALDYEHAPFDGDRLWDAPADLSGTTRTIVKLYRDGNVWSYVKRSCMHCRKPSCVSACPVKAMTKDPVTGIVDYSRDTCIGCRYCQVACAFNVPKFQWDKSIPQIVKCDLCVHTNLKSKGTTACAEACPTGAILFGKRATLLDEARKRLDREPKRYLPHIYGEHELGGTNQLVLAAHPFEKLGLPQLPIEAPAIVSERIQHTIYKGFIAPVALYFTLCLAAVRNARKNDRRHDSSGDKGKEQS